MACNAYRRTTMIHNHSAKLVAFKDFSIFADSILNKKDRARHTDFYKDSCYKQ